jgi:hypothetical protein
VYSLRHIGKPLYGRGERGERGISAERRVRECLAVQIQISEFDL